MTVGVLLALEGVFRLLAVFELFLPPNSEHPVDSFVFVDESGLLRLRPSVSADSRVCRARSFGEKIEIRIGDLGLRDFSQEGYRSKGTLFLGDSIVMSAGLETEDTFVRLVEKGCQARDPEFQGINGGIVDSGLGDHIQRLEHYLPLLEPQTVVIGLYLNDSQPSQRSLANLLTMPRWFTVLSGYSFLVRYFHPVAVTIKLRSQPLLGQRFGWIGNYLNAYPITSSERLRELVTQARYDWGAAWFEENWQQLSAQLAEAKTLLKERNTKLIVVLFPVDPQVTVHQLDDFARAPQTFFAQHCKELGIHCVDLLPAFREHPAPRELFCDQCHLTAEASRVVSRTLIPVVCPLQATESIR